jgi:hypothetical protein
VDVTALQDLRLTDSEGDSRRLGDFFERRRAVLVFLRHFG